MIKLQNMQLPVGSGENEIKNKCARILGIDTSAIRDFALSRVSIDARKRTDVHLVCAATMTLKNEDSILKRADGKNVFAFEPAEYSFPELRRKRASRPVVVGMGPAGLFAALELARAGLPPITLERGRSVSERTEDVENFWRTGVLKKDSNVQFGEGGAGTFSDGKLSTGISDPRVSRVFNLFTEHGAPRDILWSAKPHIGTDLLREVVASIRSELLERGCDIRFEHTLTGLKIDDGKLCGLEVKADDGIYEIPCDTLILAPGHSARDTFEMLHLSGLEMQQKAFAMGVRIEHLQEEISRAQYGNFAEKLPAADYKLSCHLPGGRSAYSFCICPGGQVVAAASEEGGVVTNGMSLRARDGRNINGGFLVGVQPGDFPGDDPLAGMRFQRRWEERAFIHGGGNFHAPAQKVKDFLSGRPSAGFTSVIPSYTPGVVPALLSNCLPDYVNQTLKEALPLFDRRLRGFASGDAVMTGVETRSSSPVRILRGTDMQSNIRGIYPCGEGAGYAGGITSAAVDGIKVAEAIAAAP